MSSCWVSDLDGAWASNINSTAILLFVYFSQKGHQFVPDFHRKLAGPIGRNGGRPWSAEMTHHQAARCSCGFSSKPTSARRKPWQRPAVLYLWLVPQWALPSKVSRRFLFRAIGRFCWGEAWAHVDQRSADQTATIEAGDTLGEQTHQEDTAVRSSATELQSVPS